MELRDYQLTAVEGLRQSIRKGNKNVLLCAPTGSGKTVIAMHMVKEAVKKDSRCVFVCDQINLIDQTSKAFFDNGINHGVIQANHPLWMPHRRVQVASAQTLARRQWPDADLIIVDECHTVYKTVKDRLAEKNTVAIGLTATPFTQGLGKIYDDMVNVTTTNNLRNQGFLSPFRIFAPSAPNMEGVKVLSTGEWETEETYKRVAKIVGDCVMEYKRHALGRKFICSAVDIRHARDLSQQFNNAGIHTEVYTSDVRDEERAEIITEFKKPDSVIRGLVTVVAATKGFNCEDVSCVIMARPLRKSLAQMIQFIGRGFRIHPDKNDCIILDHAGNMERFAEQWQGFFEFGITGLNSGDKKEKLKIKNADKEEVFKTCPNCKHMHAPRPFCPNCGHEYPRRSVVHSAGELKELLVAGSSKEQTEMLWPQVIRYVQETKKDNHERSALGLYRGMTGAWPLTKYSDTKPADFVTQAVRNRIRSQQIRWANSIKRKAA